MRQNRRCPKCGYDAIARIVGEYNAVDASGDYINIGFISTAAISRYICLTCGYSEEYFEGGNLNKIRSKFRRNYN